MSIYEILKKRKKFIWEVNSFILHMYEDYEHPFISMQKCEK